MAEFLPAYKAMILHECYRDSKGNLVGYANDGADKGGETFCGIARHFWPKWEGWAILDKLAKKPYLGTLPALDSLVQQFYLKNFWQPMNLAGIKDQGIANYIFDKGVNGGDETAIKVLQRCAGVTADGDCGPKTIAAVNAKDTQELLADIREAFRARYKAIVAANPSQGKFLTSWLARC